MVSAHSGGETVLLTQGEGEERKKNISRGALVSAAPKSGVDM